MLNDRERRTLARIEQHLVSSDPDFAQLFRTAARRQSGTTPRALLVMGLALMVLGTAVAAVPVAVFGMLISAYALVAAFQRNGMAGFSAA
jgi:hypothetical protein